MALRTGMIALAVSGMLAAAPGVAAADATEDYPIPHRMIITACTAEQILAAARDVEPVYYERYMIDYNNHSSVIQQSTRDQMHWFYSLTPDQRRAYADELVSNLADPLTVAWPNHAKLFFNNRGVAAHTTDICSKYPLDDPSVWNL
jgi:hypothetical protein